MTFRLPSGAMRWVVVLAGTGASYGFILGDWLALIGLLLVLGVCFGSRVCAWVLLVFYLLGSAFTVIKAASAISPDWLFVGVRVAIRVYFAWVILCWLKNDGQSNDEGEADLLPEGRGYAADSTTGNADGGRGDPCAMGADKDASHC